MIVQSHFCFTYESCIFNGQMECGQLMLKERAVESKLVTCDTITSFPCLQYSILLTNVPVLNRFELGIMCPHTVTYMYFMTSLNSSLKEVNRFFSEITGVLRGSVVECLTCNPGSWVRAALDPLGFFSCKCPWARNFRAPA